MKIDKWIKDMPKIKGIPKRLLQMYSDRCDKEYREWQIKSMKKKNKKDKHK